MIGHESWDEIDENDPHEFYYAKNNEDDRH